jgi:hypothetical protein
VREKGHIYLEIQCCYHRTVWKSRTDSLWRCQSQQSFNTLTPFNFLFYSLHVSAPTGRPQVRYTISYYFCFWRTIIIQRIHCMYAIWLLYIGMLFVFIGFSTYSPNTCHHIKYKNKNNNRRKTKASTAHSLITTTLMD